MLLLLLPLPVLAEEATLPESEQVTEEIAPAPEEEAPPEPEPAPEEPAPEMEVIEATSMPEENVTQPEPAAGTPGSSERVTYSEEEGFSELSETLDSDIYESLAAIQENQQITYSAVFVLTGVVIACTVSMLVMGAIRHA